MLRRDVGMVFQSFNLFPMFTALENVMYAPIHIKKMPKARLVKRDGTVGQSRSGKQS